ncbi:hypothetical protein [Bradyrhizobium septentrionale]|uniref:Transposase n=1 Tax=Bradyrhizobium septentrionale TaxID=1404411 RepID=A0ABZ2P9W0_9BRAD|nr:hypothetical protein [Bradyrhizobium septentrionale]UGY15516.1 hypothetical protein HAP48_0044540 [Bradyrhizobium septentrionale]UGY24100.1 hypothetical protein HU675_0040225 [Bradyrhizobium septentrionale]
MGRRLSRKRDLAAMDGNGAQPQSPALKKLNVTLSHRDIHHMIARGGCFSRLSKLQQRDRLPT